MMTPMKQLLTILLLLLSTQTWGREWSFELRPDELRFCSASKLERPMWFVDSCGIQNMMNLSFFTGTTFIPPYKDNRVTVWKNKKKWPFFVINGTSFQLYDGKDWNSVRKDTILKENADAIVSGYPILIKNGNKRKLPKSFFARRRCARTAIGFHPNGSIILYITAAGTLKDVQAYFYRMGCTDALNLDGGSSTFLYLNGKHVYSSKEGRSYPNVLYWN